MKRNKKKKVRLNYKKLFKCIFFLALFIFFIFKLTSVLLAPENTDNKEEVQTAPEPITINMVATGDIMCHLTNIKNAYN